MVVVAYGGGDGAIYGKERTREQHDLTCERER